MFIVAIKAVFLSIWFANQTSEVWGDVLKQERLQKISFYFE